MIFFGLLLSNSVSDLALKPIERMLVLVRQIASQVFKNLEAPEETDDNISDMDPEVSYTVVPNDRHNFFFNNSFNINWIVCKKKNIKQDLEDTSEIVLLEKIVKKLAFIVELQGRHAPDVGIEKEDMKAEEIGILNLMTSIAEPKEGGGGAAKAKDYGVKIISETILILT